jgi:hypothetical protein
MQMGYFTCSSIAASRPYTPPMARDVRIRPPFTAELAKWVGLVAAIGIAKRYTTRAIETDPGLGRGIGPVNHNAQV